MWESRRKGFFILICLFFSISLYAGDWDAGETGGLTVYPGNRTNRVGIFAGAWVRYDFVQNMQALFYQFLFNR
ncbi:MAG: hypothetical protein LBL24_00335 [Bacteroidales bacterium]|nr:hypothetical protein [Bacteroidales bacterium]